MNTDVRILEPGELEAPAGDIRFLFLPGPDLFTIRAKRLRFLADGHPLGDYLSFLAKLSEAQQDALKRVPLLSLPDPEEQALCRGHGIPLLGARSRPRDPAWREGLAMILRQMEEAALPTAARDSVASLMQISASGLEKIADSILAGDLTGILPRELPFIAAALQVYWVQMATALGELAFGRLEEEGVCPVCGSYPVAGVVRSRGAEQGLRYLSCSLCAAQWHLVRIKCSSCGSTQRINHYMLEGSNGAVKAESCDDCGAYLKLLYLGKESRMEAMADDLATIALDMLMDKEEKGRGGLNLFLHPGAA